MLHIFCTKKLADSIGLTLTTPGDSKAIGEVHSSWHANLFEVVFDPYLSDEYPHTYLLLVNNESLLSFYVRVPDTLDTAMLLQELPEHFSQYFLKNGFNRAQINALSSAYREVQFSRATDRSLLGYLRSYAMDYSNEIRRKEYGLNDYSEYTEFDLNTLSKRRLNNQTPLQVAKTIF